MPISLGRFELVDDGSLSQPYYRAPAGVTALIDLTPPGQDSDPNVNYAIMVSEKPLGSEFLHHQFGERLNKRDYDAWEAVTKYRPTPGLNTPQDLTVDTLTIGSDPTGQNQPRPLQGRDIECWLGGSIPFFKHRPVVGDRFEPYVRAGMLQGIRELSPTLTEDQLAKYYGGLAKTHGLTHTELLQRLPVGDEKIPRLEPKHPSTRIEESWPTVGAITGADNSYILSQWRGQGGTNWTIISGNAVSSNNAGGGLCMLDYTFGGNDFDIGNIVTVSGDAGGGIMRSDSTASNCYVTYQTSEASISFRKYVSAALTVLGNQAVATTGLLYRGTIIGSTWTAYVGGVQQLTGTDTGVATGLRAGLGSLDSSGGKSWGAAYWDDLISGGGFKSYWIQRESQVIGGGLR